MSLKKASNKKPEVDFRYSVDGAWVTIYPESAWGRAQYEHILELTESTGKIPAGDLNLFKRDVRLAGGRLLKVAATRKKEATTGDPLGRKIDNFAENLIAMLIEDSIELLPRSESNPEYIEVIRNYIEGFRLWDKISLELEIAIIERVLYKTAEWAVMYDYYKPNEIAPNAPHSNTTNPGRP